MQGLTGRQAAILSFIKQRITDDGKPPSLQVIADHFGMKSRHGVKCHLKLLEKKGILWRDNGRITLCQ